MNNTKTTKEIFERIYKRKLTDSEVAEISFNLYGFFGTLLKIDRRIKKQNKSLKEAKNE